MVLHSHPSFVWCCFLLLGVVAFSSLLLGGAALSLLLLWDGGCSTSSFFWWCCLPFSLRWCCRSSFEMKFTRMHLQSDRGNREKSFFMMVSCLASCILALVYAWYFLKQVVRDGMNRILCLSLKLVGLGWKHTASERALWTDEWVRSRWYVEQN